jgi:hypothetical protein
VFQQIPGQNRIFMAWYSQGTQVVDYVENANGTIDFKPTGWFIPEGANEWVSAVFKAERNADGSYTYYGATGDFALSGTGRNAIDIYKVTLPAPPQEDTPSPLPPAAAGDSCATSTGFRSVSARRRARGIRFDFSPVGSASTRVRLLRVSRGRTVLRQQLVRDFGQRRRGFSWRGSRRIANGYYVAEFTTTTASGRTERRRVALRRSAGRFLPLRTFERTIPCGFVQQAGLVQPVFGGSRNARATLSFRLSEAAAVDVEIRRGSRVVRRIRARSFAAGQTQRLNVSLPRSARRGEYTFTLRARTTGHTSSVTLVGRKL